MKTKCGCEIEPGGWIYATCAHGIDWTMGVGGSLVRFSVIERPAIVCLCGSTRFSKAFQQANLDLTLAGKIVLTIGCDIKSDDDLFGEMAPAELAKLKNQLTLLHFRKIDMSDAILVLNVDGYIGESTGRELAYAKAMGKRIMFLEGTE